VVLSRADEGTVVATPDYTLSVESEPMRDPDALPQVKLSYHVRLRREH
jgi:hypothetical protein